MNRLVTHCVAVIGTLALLSGVASIQVNATTSKQTIVLTEASPYTTIASGSDTLIYGTSEPNQIIIESGSKAKLLNFPGSNTITIEANSGLFIVSRSGVMVTLEGADGTLLKIPASETTQSIVFEDCSLSLMVDSGQVMLNSQVVNNISESIQCNTELYYLDSDDDGYGDPSYPYEASSQPAGHVTNHNDCNDSDPDIHPGAEDIPGDGIDQDCDGIDTPISSAETLSNSLGMTFVRIEPGTFIMGSPEDELKRGSDETQHQVTLTQEYYMQTTEVTQGQWKAVMGSNPSYFSSCGDDCPVEMVSWFDARDFIDKLNTRGEGVYALPTEAQWEYAARAGSTTATPHGDVTEVGCGYDPNVDDIGWYCGNSHGSGDWYFGARGSTHPVAQKISNDWGLYDMHGNVWEWCSDLSKDYPSEAVTDPENLPPLGFQFMENIYFANRGGGWDNYARTCRSANRDGRSPTCEYRNLGFRLILFSDR